LLIVGAVIILGIVGLVLFVNISPTTQPIPGVDKFSGLSREHVTGPQNYTQSPPVGGTHSPVWVNCGVYDQPVPEESAVHSLEHGAVWITYLPNLPDDQVQALRALARNRGYLLVSPWKDDSLPSPIVASAWGLQLKVDQANDPRLAEFARRYANGPQTPEPGALCSGGVGSPLPNS